jgi:hypothetical protein
MRALRNTGRVGVLEADTCSQTICGYLLCVDTSFFVIHFADETKPKFEPNFTKRAVHHQPAALLPNHFWHITTQLPAFSTKVTNRVCRVARYAPNPDLITVYYWYNKSSSSSSTLQQHLRP